MVSNIFNYALRKIKYCLILFVFGCSSVNTINMQSHNFNEIPAKIIWIQLAGLSLEHLAMLRFTRVDSKKKLSLENVSCLGKMWNYNLYQLRPLPSDGFLSQMTGKSNIKSGCEDFQHTSLWSLLNSSGYQTGIIESGYRNEEKSLLHSLTCKEKKNQFLKGVSLWSMSSPPKGSKTFHYLDKDASSKGEILYDKSCQKDRCSSTLFNNVKSTYSKFVKNKDKILFIVRDFSYFQHLQAKEIGEARVALSEIERIFQFFKEINQKKDFLLVLSSSGGKNFEFPNDGKGWAEFEKSGKSIIYRHSSLISPVLAFGAGAENFCGIFEESQILKRFLWRPKGANVPFFEVFKMK